MFEFFNKSEKYVFGGYINDSKIKYESTSGGAFSAIVDTFCQDNYVIFGAESDGLDVFHSFITNKKELSKFRKSKYSQSDMKQCYRQCKSFLNAGKNVLFSGTPCQIGALKLFLNQTHTCTDNLLTVEVICEGVPSPLYVKKYEQSLGDKIIMLDYRHKGKSLFGNSKWDFQIMHTVLANTKEIKKDRWFNPFWSIWLNHLMSRPCCYECPFAQRNRVADITLGDLWGVHLYCPELYGKNGGASLIVANTEKGTAVVKASESLMYGHTLVFEEALKFQSPMRQHITTNPKRDEFMDDLKSDMSFHDINKKWAIRPSIKLLWMKYIWGNRQKIAYIRIKEKIIKNKEGSC